MPRGGPVGGFQPTPRISYNPETPTLTQHPDTGARGSAHSQSCESGSDREPVPAMSALAAARVRREALRGGIPGVWNPPHEGPCMEDKTTCASRLRLWA